MYLIIEDADASDSNIGNVTLPFNPIPQTQEYLAAISSEGFSDAKKIAIDTFFRRIVNTGLISKISRLYLPVFGRVDGGVNMVSPEDSNLGFPSTGATYDASGVNFTSAWTSPFSVNTTDLLMGAWNSGVVASDALNRYSLGNAGLNFLLGRRLNASAVNPAFIRSSSDRAFISGAGSGIGLQLGCVKQAEGVMSCMFDGIYGVKNPMLLTTPATLSFSFSSSSAVAHKLYVFGSYMTESEMGFLTEYVNDLITGI